METAYVSDYTLTPASPLNGFSKRYGDTELSEHPALDIVSLATPNGGDETLNALVLEKVGAELPETGRISRADDSSMFLGLQPDQCFLVSESQRLQPALELKNLLGDAAYVSDQSDSWAVLEIKGPKAHAALERICPIDISANVFDEDSVARTSMEHLSVIIHRHGTDGYRLYSPRSSANSFLHAVTESLYNVSSTTQG